MKKSIFFFSIIILLFSNWPVSGGSGGHPGWRSSHIDLSSSELVCDIPGGLNTTNITQSSATWDWNAANGAISYSIEWRYPPNGVWYNLSGGPWMNTHVNIIGLQAGTTYEWRVRSNCANGEYSAWSVGNIFTTLSSSCPPPSGLYTSNITETSATFYWNPVPGAQHYSLQTRLPNGTWNFVPGSPFSGTSATVNWFSPGTTYEWRVRTNCMNGYQSSWTQGMNFTTAGTSTCEVPGGLVTLNITQTTATWDWAPASGAMSYSVQWRYPNGQWHNLFTGTWTQTHVNVAGLQPGTTYEWRVRSNCANGAYSDYSPPTSFTTLSSSCSTPTGLYTTNVTETSATFNWSPVAGALSYSVQVRYPNGIWNFIPGSPFTGTSATVHNLFPGTNYEWRVRANCHYGDHSFWSNGMPFTTLGSSSCNVPTGLVTINITQTTATWDWAPAVGAISYSIQWRYPNGNWNNLSGGPWTNTHINVAGLQPGTTYEWRVRSNCSNGTHSDWSIHTTFTTLSSSCSTPTGLYTTDITETSATFNWNPVAGANSYSVQIRLPNGFWTFIPGSPFTGTSATVYNLSPGTSYLWRVRANCSFGDHSFWSSSMSFTTLGSPGSCDAPAELTTYNITQTTATWDWSPVPGAINYSIQWRFPNGAWHNLGGGPWSNTQINVAGMSPGTTYEWRVRAYCGNGIYSEWSIPDVFTTLMSNCIMPTGLTTTNITETSATFNWSAVPGAMSYSVQRRVPNGTWFFIPGSPFTSTSVTVTGLSPGTNYEWRVRTNCAGGDQSAWTPGVPFTTLGSGSGPANDNCSSATLLTVNTSCMSLQSSNVNATASMPPPMGGCSSSGYKDVWFRFVMPNTSNPSVTIRTTAGSLADAVMEVYLGDDCGNLQYLSCEDDNTNGNGSMMPVINLIGYPNAMIFVRVWGYLGSTGTFNICVFDYYSANYEVPGSEIISNIGESLEEPVNTASHLEDNEITPLLSVAPNPATDILKVMFTETETTKVTGLMLIDMSGQVILRNKYIEDEIDEFNEQLDVSRLSPGIYVLQLITTTGIFTERISVVD